MHHPWEEAVVGLNLTHSEMCKFSDPQDDNYLSISARMRMLAQQIIGLQNNGEFEFFACYSLACLRLSRLTDTSIKQSLTRCTLASFRSLRPKSNFIFLLHHSRTTATAVW
jgi:hypothetical protein